MTLRGQLAPFEDDYDPFEAFDRATGSQTVADPYPEFAQLRKQASIQKVDLRRLYGLDSLDADVELPDAYAVLSHDAVARVLKDGEVFSSAGYAMSMGVVMGHTILEMDEPEHHAYRALVQQAFTRKAMERWRDQIVRPVIDRFIDEFAGDGRAELVHQLTFPFPVQVIAALLGLPDEDLDNFHAWAVGLTNVGSDPEHGMEASVKLRDYFAEVLEERRGRPSDDVISLLARAELDGQRLTDDEIFAFLRLLLPAGAETTYRSSSNLLVGLLTNPRQLNAVRQDRSLITHAIEEGLRWEPPLTGIMRTATRDVEIDGVTVPAGSVVNVNVGSANRDEARYREPDRFDLWRDPVQHMAFAYGPHMCLGMHLARMETTVLINVLFDRLRGLRLDPSVPPPQIRGLIFRAPSAIHVVFD